MPTKHLSALVPASRTALILSIALSLTTLRSGHLGAYGDSRDTDPTLRELGSEGRLRAELEREETPILPVALEPKEVRELRALGYLGGG